MASKPRTKLSNLVQTLMAYLLYTLLAVGFIKLLKYNQMETKYSKEQFEGFTHRFIVKFKVDEDWRNDSNITLYSNSESYQKLEDFINAKKGDKVVSFKIEHRASKEQDEMASKFIDEMLADGEF